MPREPAWLTSEAPEGGAQAASSERRAGCPEGTSGDGVWATQTRANREFQVRAV